MQTWVERSSPNLVPIKSSLSILLGDAQVWSTVCVPAGWLGNGVEDVDELHVFARRLAARKEDAQECEKRAKKSRQVFTCSQPVAGVVADFTGEDVEVYESVGGQDLFCGVEPHLGEEPKQACQPCTGPVTDATTEVLEPDRRNQSIRDFASGISLLKPTRPQEARSECELKTCFPSPAKPSLLYTVSDSSLPILKQSSVIFTRLSNQMPVHFLGAGLEKELAIPPRTIIPMYGIRPSCFSYDLLGRSILFNPHCKDILIKYKNMDDALVRKIAQTIQTVNEKAQRGKFMSYAKFNSSFKLSEVFYEDINSRCLSHVPSLVPPFRLSGLIHRVNPEYDENQSMSEAMTLMSLSNITSMSRTAKTRRLASSVNSITSEQIESDFSFNTDPKPTKHFEDSQCSDKYGISLTHAVTTARKQQISRLQDFMRRAIQEGQKETDIWSSATSGCKDKSTPKRLVDVSPSCIFRASVADKKKLPVWKLKLEKPGMAYRTELVNDFIFKAHNYMHVRDRPNSHKCFFQQQPTYRVVDEGVQFPDVAVACDRSSNVKEPLSDISPSKNTDVSCQPKENNKVDEKSSTLPSEITSVTAVHPENKILTNLVVLPCDKPFSSTSEFRTVSSDPAAALKTGIEESSSMNLPASTSSNRCPFSSSEYQTISTGPPLQPRNRKLAGKSPPELKIPKHCPNRRLPHSSAFCHSYPALCDKRKIKIKYENGKFTVLKEKDGPKRQTVWSIITGKATHLLNSVVHRTPHVHQASGR